MKSNWKLFGILALIAAMAFTGCPGGDDNGNTNTTDPAKLVSFTQEGGVAGVGGAAPTASTTKLVLTFDKNVSKPSSGWDVSGDGEVYEAKGEWAVSGKTWTLEIDALETDEVTATFTNAAGIENGSKTAWVYKEGGLPPVTYSASANGATDAETSTVITITFSDGVTGLVEGDITIAEGTGKAAKGTLDSTSDNKVWKLNITVEKQGTITLTIHKDGITSAPHTNIAVYLEKLVLVVENGLPDGYTINEFQGVEGNDSYGISHAPDGSPAYWFNNRAPNDAVCEWMLNKDLDATAYDYLYFEITADTFVMLDWMAGIYPKFRIYDNWDNSANFQNNDAIRDVADYARESFSKTEWYEVIIPISAKAGWRPHDGNIGNADALKTVRQFKFMFPFRKDGDGGYPDKGNAADKIYFRGFRLEKSDSEHNPSLTVPMGLPKPLDDNSVKAAEVLGGKWGKKLAPDGNPAFFFHDVLTGHGSYELEFPNDGMNQNQYDATAYDYFSFEIHADSFAMLNALVEFYPRFRQPSVWHHIQFNASGILRQAIDNAGGQAKWLTIKVPISAKAGMNVHDQWLGDPATGSFDSVMKSVGMIMPRFILSQDFRNNPTSEKIYLRNLKLEKADEVGLDLIHWINPNEVKAVEGMKRPELYQKGFDDGAFWFVAAEAGNDVFYELEFPTPGDNNNRFDASAWNYFTFEIRADTWKMLNGLQHMFPRFKRPDPWHHVQYDFGIRGEVIDKIGGQSNFSSNTWYTVKVPIAKNGTNIHEQFFGDPPNQSTFETVMQNCKQFMVRLALTDDYKADPGTDKLYFRNFKLTKD